MIKKNKVVDLFAGAGGFGLGFHLAKYKLIFSLEKDDWAVETLRENAIDSHKIVHANISRYRTEKQIKAICKSKPNVIIGGPPCQGFSVAGLDRRHSDDPRNFLFKYFVKWVKYLKPQVFVLENVKGILSLKNEKHEKTIDAILYSFKDIGYHVEIWELNAAEYGVPQTRERVFIVGNIYNKKIGPPQKTHFIKKSKVTNTKNKFKKAVSVWEAISDLSTINAGEGEEIMEYVQKPQSPYQKLIRRKSNNLFNHVAMDHRSRIIRRFKKIQEGYSLSEIPSDLKVKSRNGNGKDSDVEFNSNYRHLKKNSISFTIPAHFYSSFIHPTRPRNITAREAARLQSFPDWYKFMGKRTVISSKLLTKLGKHEENFLSQYNQIGNAVPPLMAKAIALKLEAFLNRNK